MNSTDVSGCDEYSAADIANLQVFSEPDAHNREKNYTHTFERISKGCAGIYNEKLGCGVSIRFPVDKLPFLTQWKMEGVRAVSYTHLDVYKRQMWRWILQALIRRLS